MVDNLLFEAGQVEPLRKVDNPHKLKDIEATVVLNYQTQKNCTVIKSRAYLIFLPHKQTSLLFSANQWVR